MKNQWMERIAELEKENKDLKVFLDYYVERDNKQANIPPDLCPACGAPMISVDDYQLNTSGVYAGTKHICTSRRTTGCK